jgi:hypothetical protein
VTRSTIDHATPPPPLLLPDVADWGTADTGVAEPDEFAALVLDDAAPEAAGVEVVVVVEVVDTRLFRWIVLRRAK